MSADTHETYPNHGWCTRCGWSVCGSKHPGGPCPACGTTTVAYGPGDLKQTTTTKVAWELKQT